MEKFLQVHMMVIIEFFNIYIGDCTYRILEHKYSVNCFIQFNDGRVLSGASDGFIKVWW